MRGYRLSSCFWCNALGNFQVVRAVLRADKENIFGSGSCGSSRSFRTVHGKHTPTRNKQKRWANAIRLNMIEQLLSVLKQIDQTVKISTIFGEQQWLELKSLCPWSFRLSWKPDVRSMSDSRLRCVWSCNLFHRVPLVLENQSVAWWRQSRYLGKGVKSGRKCQYSYFTELLDKMHPISRKSTI